MHHEGRFVVRPDLLYRAERVAIEHDGDGHRTGRGQWQVDVARDERLRSLGWEVLHVTQTTLEEPAAFLHRLEHALQCPSPRSL
ncbi:MULTISPECIES: DUF559 domain-containing protein [unclassified Agrococcus]|uniref:DUF559 domain-containing protein n=1 Tax=unclassified Agrococcus TaxID=2615065 RepID=UPI00360EC504